MAILLCPGYASTVYAIPAVEETEKEIMQDSAMGYLSAPVINIPPIGTLPMLDSLASAQLPSEDAWWRNFNDPTLTSLIGIAVSHNYSLKMAMQRIELGRNALRQSQAGYFPTVGLSAGWEIDRSSGMLNGSGGRASTMSYFNIGANVSWEADLFGRIRQQMKAGKAGYNASRADYTAAMIDLCSQIASDYVNLLLYKKQLEIAARHIKSQQRVVAITVAREEAGLASMLDVAQARTMLYSTEATLPHLEALICTTISNIEMLCGDGGEQSGPLLSSCPSVLPDGTQAVPSGIPSDLVRRRPDIIAAQYELDRAAALVGVAKKDYLPSLVITGSIGTSARNVKDLFSGQSFTFMVSPQITWTAFDGRLRGLRLAEQKLALEEQLQSYNLTVAGAVNDVNNAISAYMADRKQIELEEIVVKESELTLSLAIDRYKQGLSPFTNVVQAQQDLLTSQNSLESAKAASLRALVTLYTAMGGGWSSLPGDDLK